jgi:hypothetical protein
MTARAGAIRPARRPARKRVICTHRGSFLARRQIIRRLIERFVRLP